MAKKIKKVKQKEYCNQFNKDFNRTSIYRKVPGLEFPVPLFSTREKPGDSQSWIIPRVAVLGEEAPLPSLPSF